MLKKFLTLLLCSIMLTGCGSKSSLNEISFSTWGSVTEIKILKELISDFEKENPNTKVNLIHIPQNYFQKLHLLFASNTAPDVVFINDLYLPLYSSYLMDLSEVIDLQNYFSAPLECLTIDNKLLAIPRDASNLVLYVNTDIIKKMPTPFELEDIIKITSDLKKKNIYGISYEEDIYWAQPYLSYFGEYFGEKFNSQDSQGFKFYKGLRDKYKIVPTKSQIGSSTLAQMFLDGKIAMYLSGKWMYPKILENAKFNWVVTPFPKGIGVLPCNASGWAISKNTKNKELAIRFVQYLSKEKSMTYLTSTGLIVPANKKSAEKLNNKDHNEYVFLEVLESSKSIPITKNYKKNVDEFNSKNF